MTRDPKLSKKQENLIGSSKSAGTRNRRQHVVARDRHSAAMKVRALLQSCQEFANPGDFTLWGPPDDPVVEKEQMGTNDLFPVGNRRFCERWVRCEWIPTAKGIETVLGSSFVRGMKPTSPEAKLIKPLFVKLLVAKDPEVEAKKVYEELAVIRKKLGPDRYRLSHFFNQLRGSVPIPQPPDHVDPTAPTKPRHLRSGQTKRESKPPPQAEEGTSEDFR